MSDTPQDQLPHPSASTSEVSYEFTEEQNIVLYELAGGLQFVALIAGLFSGVLLIASVVGLVFTQSSLSKIVIILMMLTGLVLAPSSLWTWRSAKAFDQVVHTQGKDIQNLMGALSQLARYYSFLRLSVVLALSLITVMLIAGLVLVERASR